MRKRMIFVARYFSIEPLGIHYLVGLLRDLDWDCRVVLVHNHGDDYDFEPLYEAVREWKPDLVGFQIWTGWHLQSFAACDTVRAMGVSVIIGGPHATYFDQECGAHADHVVKGDAFGLLREILTEEHKSGIHFDSGGREEVFPFPDRSVIYNEYPELANSPIKSMFASVGCPFTCTYCYAPAKNQMYGGFALTVRPVDELINEARAIQERWPLRTIYFQDDIFGYNLKWLQEFSRRWKNEVGAEFHAQIRLELTRNEAGEKRLDLFAEAGCSGITLAIESGSQFMRDRVLFRHMDEDLIIEGCDRIMSRGMSLRTEQILAVPFSDVDTDLSTLRLNNRINPTMAWCSLLAPYGGTDIGKICTNFGFHSSNNDDLVERSYERSTLRHPAGGTRDIEPMVEKLGINPSAPPALQPLVNMRAVRNGDRVADVFYYPPHKQSDGTYTAGEGRKAGTIEYLDPEENERYREDSLRTQRLFNFLAKVHDAEGLGRKLIALGDNAWNWEQIGGVTTKHLQHHVPAERLEERRHALAREMQLASPEDMPEPVKQNPHYFTYFPAGGVLAQRLTEQGVFDSGVPMADMLDTLSTHTRRHLFHFGLYKIENCDAPIAV